MNQTTSATATPSEVVGMIRDRWVVAYEFDGSGWRVTADHRIAVEDDVEIGRMGRVPLGVQVPDMLVSRRALRVRATARGWSITVTNRNGAVLHPWCLPPQRVSERELQIDWPLVAVRMLPDCRALQHWVLLESDDPHLGPVVECPGLFPEIDESTETTTVDAIRPTGLTRAEREALHMVFQAQLCWPPVEPAEPMLLKQAAARLSISISGLQDRLRAAQFRARALGHDRRVALTDPTYLYALARAGYLDPPTCFPHREEVARAG
jgi:hypothetical protein